MATNQSVKKFQRVLAVLPSHIQAPIRAEIFSEAAFLAEAMRIAVPRKNNTLWQSIRVEPSARPMRALVRAGGRTTTGGSPPYDYALAQEFGTEKTPARPYFWPTYRAKRKSIRRAVKVAATAAINQLVPLQGGPK
jgi:hypothetical protein